MKKKTTLLFVIYLFILFIISFCLQLHKLGNTLDEWPIMYAHLSAGNTNLQQYTYYGNRPSIAWIWNSGFTTLGYRSINWQIVSLLFRFLTVVLTWLAWRKLWSENYLETMLAAALFAIYPIFVQQPQAITFSAHWICYSFYSVSILLMISAVKNQKNKIPLFISSILTGLVNMMTMEYFIGLELMRPIVLWIALDDKPLHVKEKIFKIFKLWIPYLITLILYVPYRFYWLPSPNYNRNSPDKLINLLKDPIHYAGTWILTIIRDFTHAVFGVWANTINIEDITVESRSSLMALVVVLCVFILSALFFLYYHKKLDISRANENGNSWYLTAIPFGIFSFLFGLAPIWSINTGLTPVGLYNDRFGLPVMAGVSLIILGIFNWLSAKRTPQILIICILLGLGAGLQYRNQTSYANSWEQQKRIFNELKWRVPDIEHYTVFYGDGVLADYMGSWADIAAFNSIYPYRKNSFDNTWYFNTFKPLTPEELEPNVERRYKKLENLEYIGNTSNSLVIQIKSQSGQCVWVLTEEDMDNPYMSEYLIPPLHLSNLDRIIPDADTSLREDVFGEELPHTWCYYFERADLARQQQDWEKIMDLWHESQTNGYQPAVAVEYRPFIEAAAYTGDMDLAIDLTERANDKSIGMRSYLCGTWDNIKLHSLDQSLPIEQVENIIQCETLDEDKSLIQENEK